VIFVAAQTLAMHVPVAHLKTYELLLYTVAL